MRDGQAGERTSKSKTAVRDPSPAGAAQLLAGAVDDAMMPGVLGCIAGDDTVLVVTRSPQVAAEVAGHLLALADPSTRT